jgi:4-hydroxybenzoate polyprenyltransferase
METTVHKKSLIYSLQENKENVKKKTRLLVFFAIVITAFLLVFAFVNIRQWYAFAIIFFSGYVLYLCYKIFSHWQKHKKIKAKLKTL